MIPGHLQRRATGLSYWAEGIRAQEAAVKLIVAFSNGLLLDGPWIRSGGFGSFWFDTNVAEAEGVHLSGGERRVLAIASSLASSDHPVDIGDTITGLDSDALGHVLEGLAYAGGINFLSPRP